MTVDELYDQCMTLTQQERTELLCFMISQTVKKLDDLEMDWAKELAGRPAAELEENSPWRPSLAFMVKFRERCTTT
jgi:hypothetical protein